VHIFDGILERNLPLDVIMGYCDLCKSYGTYITLRLFLRLSQKLLFSDRNIGPGDIPSINS
jgi:hypothetical protein